jgi:transcriptional regulator with XRE-family HTH domain
MPDRLRAVQLRVGRHVQRLRRARGLTQDGLAEKTGYDLKRLSQVERGRINPSLATLERIARALDVDVADLVARPPRRKADPPLYVVTRSELKQLERVIKNIRSAKQTPSDGDRD